MANVVHFVHLWQMLLATVAIEIATLFVCCFLMADVIAICLVEDVLPLLKYELADVIAKWQMLSHYRVVVWWQMLLPVVDGKTTGSITLVSVLRC